MSSFQPIRHHRPVVMEPTRSEPILPAMPSDSDAESQANVESAPLSIFVPWAVYCGTKYISVNEYDP